MIPLFEPSTIPDFPSHANSLPHPLLARPSGSGEADVGAILDAHTRRIHDQIALLTGIQARIDGVIADLTSVLDNIGSAGALGLQRPSQVESTEGQAGTST